MLKKITFFALFATISLGLFSQRPTLELTFTAENNGVYVQLDSIKIMNRTQGGDTVLYWPDTVLSIYYVGTPEVSKGENSFQVFQNYPNPVADQTTVSLYVPEKDKVSITVTDILGRRIVNSERLLDKGKHSFRFTPGNSSLYFFTARWQGQGSSIKILQEGFHSGGTATLEYTGSEDYFPQLKAIEDIQDFSFSPGDELLYIGYANGLESGMLDAPQENQAYTFQFATNIPCPGTPTVEYEGQVYNTIQIFSQCWLKENLNVGTMIPGSQSQSNNGTIEKYCYNNEPDSCTMYGGLYQWWEMMQYTTQQGARGICPPGWHLPTDEEWKVLEGAVDSQYGIGDPVWDLYWEYRGYDAGTNLKTTSGWYYGGNGTDLFGFSGLPGGGRDGGGDFGSVGGDGGWWASTEGYDGDAWDRGLSYGSPEVGRGDDGKEGGFSVRCLRDY
ncbi:MAG: T9SS type A sorting domain-containing protein [Bacteroidales bacterium]|nr:T9SS type A sorting domain-containing protein [Bacteroidales bacterium]